MFTGIIESLGIIEKIKKEQGNVHFTLSSPIARELKIDQSVSHNGVCLTVVDINDGLYTVTAVEETLRRTALGELKEGNKVNLERAMLLNARLDGHIVQGHVDGTARCSSIEETNGSWRFQFTSAKNFLYPLVDKGSVCVNGVSLTVVDPDDRSFSAAIIPYTFDYTNFGRLRVGDSVNLEFDLIGKYVTKLAETYFKSSRANILS